MFGKNNNGIRRFKPLKVLFFLIVFIAIAAALSWVVMFLWNTILTDVTNVKPLNFWKAAGLLLLSKILFGGFGGWGSRRNHSKRKEWKNKWMNMNPEERMEAKSRWKEYCKRRDSGRKHE